MSAADDFVAELGVDVVVVAVTAGEVALEELTRGDPLGAQSVIMNDDWTLRVVLERNA